MNEKIRKQLEQIAMEESYALECRGDLKERMNDDEDYPEISVWALQKMLERAYELGKNSK